MFKLGKSVQKGLTTYNAEVGRFINRDIVEDSNGMTLYIYVHNNPINLNDPEGLVNLKLKDIVKPTGEQIKSVFNGAIKWVTGGVIGTIEYRKAIRSLSRRGPGVYITGLFVASGSKGPCCKNGIQHELMTIKLSGAGLVDVGFKKEKWAISPGVWQPIGKSVPCPTPGIVAGTGSVFIGFVASGPSFQCTTTWQHLKGWSNWVCKFGTSIPPPVNPKKPGEYGISIFGGGSINATVYQVN